MSLIDFILNLAGLLLWISWRHIPFDPINKIRPATLTGTLRRAEPTRVRAWHFLVALIGLLLVRAVLYWWIGGALSWTPSINTEIITISFRGDLFGRIMVYSFASFAHLLMIYYLGLLLLSLLHPRSSEAEPCRRFVKIQLGVIHGWPWQVKLLLPFVSVGLAWLMAEPLLGLWDIVPRATSWIHRGEQAALLGTGVYLIWRYVIGAVLALHLLNTYIYFGSQPLWNFINDTGQRLLSPLRRLPLRIGRVDFAPLIGIALLFIVAELLENGLHKEIPGLQTQINVPGLVDIYRKISG